MISKTASVDLLSRVLEAAHVRHAVIAHNLANVNTPNFRRLEVPFALELSRTLGPAGPAAPPGWPGLPGSVGSAVPPIIESEAVAREDGNTVDLEAEIAVLQRNSLLTAAATQILAQQLSQWRSAITGR